GEGTFLASFGNQSLILNQGEEKEVVFNSEIDLPLGNYFVMLFYSNGNSLNENSLYGFDSAYSLSFTLVDTNTVGAEQISRRVEVVFEQSNLRVTSPAGETIAVYSFSGQLLFLEKKPEGSILFMTGNRISEKAVIVSGSSGWVKKITR
ncbi:MAG: hypothetical protein LBQ73_05450, partial [Tannerellaceae bacterium]|nr:hypothetical protein [Tannerellaceae bacterium]